MPQDVGFGAKATQCQLEEGQMLHPKGVVDLNQSVQEVKQRGLLAFPHPKLPD